MFKGLLRSLGQKSEGNRVSVRIPDKLKYSLDENILSLRQIFKDDETFKVREFQNQFGKDFRFCIFYIEGMTDSFILNEHIIKPLQERDILSLSPGKHLIHEMVGKILNVNNIALNENMESTLEALLYGDILLLADGYPKAMIIDAKGWETRSIEQPVSEPIVRGPREGFNESMITNLSLIRRKIQNANLKFQFKKLGVQTKTRICICFIEGLASEEVLDELHDRLEKIKIDGILDSGYIQELIKDSPYSPFDTVGTTERPDVVAGKLLEGRIAIVVDGSPFVLTVPYLYVEYFQVNEDYYSNYIYSSFNRFIRIVGATLTVTVPAAYVAITTFHQELLPTPLLLSISSAREGVPFPTVIEAMLMIFIFEILREAGTRIPASIGQTVSIVGALVLGQAAAEARIVSAPIIIVTALTGITSLLSVRLLGAPIIFRLVFLLLSSTLGLFGLVFGFLGLVIHLMDLRSFGIPFALNIATTKGQDFKDTAIRVPWWLMRFRPSLLSENNQKRQAGKKTKG